MVDGNTESSDKKIQEKLDKLEELKRKQDELAAEIDEIKRDIGNALVEDDITIKTSYVSKRLIQGNITHRSGSCQDKPCLFCYLQNISPNFSRNLLCCLI